MRLLVVTIQWIFKMHGATIKIIEQNLVDDRFSQADQPV
jgi:hypothetical protein